MRSWKSWLAVTGLVTYASTFIDVAEIKVGEVSDIVQQYLGINRHVDFADPDATAGQCASYSRRFYEWLAAAHPGIPETIVGLYGLNRDVGKAPAAIWRNAPPGALVHHVVAIDCRWVVDLTGAQFGKGVADRYVYPYSDLESDWQIVRPGYGVNTIKGQAGPGLWVELPRMPRC